MSPQSFPISHDSAEWDGHCRFVVAGARSDLIADLVAHAPYLRRADAEAIVLMIFDQIADALARGQRVELRDFGAFTVKAARRAGRAQSADRRGGAGGGEDGAGLQGGRETAPARQSSSLAPRAEQSGQGTTAAASMVTGEAKK